MANRAWNTVAEMAASRDKPTSSWYQRTGALARRSRERANLAARDEPEVADDFADLAGEDAPDDNWADALISADDVSSPDVSSPPSAQASDAGDEFGVRLRWPSGAPTPRREEPQAPTAAIASDEFDYDAAAEPGLAGPSTASADGAPAPMLPVMAARVETVQALLSSMSLRVDAQAAATTSAIEAVSERLEDLAAAVDRVEANGLGDAGEHDAGGVLVTIEGALNAIVDDVAALRAEVAQLKRRLPVRPKQSSPDVDGLAEAVRELLAGEELAGKIADVVIGRLLESVDVVEVVDQPSGDPGPDLSPVPAKRQGRRPLVGRERG